ncbi:hypothetical protein SDC9_104551 [bioreactor metagenome]|uniref:Uncharacterized protein n=1 Tax=bioreactor metagenome TaxID=1076179 RepID=A0A645AY96_9ZZZZ
MLEEFTEGMGCGGKARGHTHTLGQLGDHLAERGVLATYDLDVAHSQVLKRNDQGGRLKACRHGEAPEFKNRCGPASLVGSNADIEHATPSPTLTHRAVL